MCIRDRGQGLPASRKRELGKGAQRRLPQPAEPCRAYRIPAAVSYTHLDVYKRQALHPRFMDLPGGSEEDGDRLLRCVGFLFLLKFSYSAGARAVSYTHLDVYKRQRKYRKMAIIGLIWNAAKIMAPSLAAGEKRSMHCNT